MATRDLTRRFAELRVLRHGVEGAVLEGKRPADAFSESGLLDVRGRIPTCLQLGDVLLLRVSGG